MKDKYFIDTNIWVYLYSDSDKSIIAKQIIEEKFDNSIISTQVLTELYNVLLKKGFKSKDQASQIVIEVRNSFQVSSINADSIVEAIRISNESQYSIYDSLIIAIALQNQCTILYSEDLHDQQIIDKRLKIVNPFRKP